MKYIKEVYEGDIKTIETFEADSIEEVVNLKIEVEKTERWGYTHAVVENKRD